MTDYQKAKIHELRRLGWSEAEAAIPGYTYRMTNTSGMRAYIYPD